MPLEGSDEEENKSKVEEALGIIESSVFSDIPPSPTTSDVEDTGSPQIPDIENAIATAEVDDSKIP
jgi:hypothetical protein